VGPRRVDERGESVLVHDPLDVFAERLAAGVLPEIGTPVFPLGRGRVERGVDRAAQ